MECRNQKEKGLWQEELVLFDQVQFIYELALAQLELTMLGVKFTLEDGLREFRLVEAEDIPKAGRRLAYFARIAGTPTVYSRIIGKNRTRSVNQYLTHWIYPYKGKFHPQMVRALCNIIGLNPGDTVLDPFVGSGTTALEAQLLGVHCIGIDVSPLSVLQTRVKTESVFVLPDILQWRERVESLLPQRGKTGGLDLSFIPEERVRNFYLMAQLVATSDHTRRRRDFPRAFLQNLQRMVGSVSDYAELVRDLPLELGRVDIRVGDARNLPLLDESVDGIITSPPYSIALDYVVNDAHAFREMGYDPLLLRESFIGVRGKGREKIALYNEDLKQSIREMARVLKPGKQAVIVLGNATHMGGEIPTVTFFTDCAQTMGFRLCHNLKKIIFGLYNVMQRENILIFQKG
ncbi:MAG: DNA methyltransferase [Atribacterota bacterium]